MSPEPRSLHPIRPSDKIRQVGHIVLRPGPSLRNRPSKAVLRRTRHRRGDIGSVGHRLYIAQILVGVGKGEAVRLAVALQCVAHEGLVKAAIHAAPPYYAVKGGDADADLARQGEGFGVDRGVAERKKVVQKLHPVAIADAADMDDLAGPGGDDGLDPCEDLIRGADHAVERALPRLFRRAAQGGVGEVDALPGEFAGEALGHGGVGGGAVDDHCAGFQVGGDAGDCLGHLRRAGKGEEDDAGGGGEGFRRGSRQE